MFSGRRRIRRVRAAVLYLMRYVGLQGRCDCVLTCDERGHPGLLVRIDTRQFVPFSERQHFESYFCRKLGEFGELGVDGRWALRLVIRDRDELATPRLVVSSQRIASILRAFNDPVPDARGDDERVLELRESVRQRLSARREERGNTGYAPLADAVLTDLGALGQR